MRYPRVRSRTLTTSEQDRGETYRVIRYSDGRPDEESNHTYQTYRTLKSGSEAINGYVCATDDWVNNPVTHTRQFAQLNSYWLPVTVRSSPNSISYYYEKVVGNKGTSASDTGELVLPSSTELNAKFNDSLLAAMEGVASGIQLPVAIAEIGQTLSMVKKPYAAFKQLKALAAKDKIVARWVRKARGMSCGQAAKSAARGAADGWLTWRYGVEQLARDVKAVGEMSDWLEERQRDRERRSKRVNRISSCVVVQANVAPAVFPTLTTDVNVKQIDIWQKVYTRQAKVAVSFPPEHISVYRDTIRYCGIGQLTSAAWEIIPFSFVLDWFIPIGGMLANYDTYLRRDTKCGPYMQIIPLTASTSERKTVTTRNKHRRVNGSGYLVSGPFDAARSDEKSYTRSECWTLDLQALVEPQATRWTAKRFADSSALLVQRLAR